MLNRSTFAFFVALLVHIVLFLLLWILYSTATADIKKELHKQEKKIKISLKELPIKHKKSGLTKKKVPEPKIAPPMPKGSQLKKIVKPQKPIKPVKYEPKKLPKKPKLNKPKKTKKQKSKPEKKHKTAKVPPLQKEIKKALNIAKQENNTTQPPKKKKDQKHGALAWLYEDVSAHETKQQKKRSINDNSSISQNIKELYGEEFGKLTPGQQQYILDNQEIMRRITQQVLNRVARVNLPRDLRVNRSNIVEFKLHPNGDMTDFRFLSKSGYYILDATTQETIEYAYSRYPRPKETTLIRYNVYYNLAY